MPTNVTPKMLQEHFRKHDSITVYKSNGAEETFAKQYRYVLHGGGVRFTFPDYESLMDYCKKAHLSLEPVVTVHG